VKIDPKKLSVFWSKRENDFLIRYPRKCDGHLIYGRLMTDFFPKYERGDKSFIDELEKRGYDLQSMKFEIRLKEKEDA
jgi:hypothetical protein